MLKFESESIDLTLVLKGKDGKERTFVPRKAICAKFADEVYDSIQAYMKRQEALEEDQKDVGFHQQLKCLEFTYGEIDEEWIMENFTATQINKIGLTVSNGLAGVKTEG